MNQITPWVQLWHVLRYIKPRITMPIGLSKNPESQIPRCIIIFTISFSWGVPPISEAWHIIFPSHQYPHWLNTHWTAPDLGVQLHSQLLERSQHQGHWALGPDPGNVRVLQPTWLKSTAALSAPKDVGDLLGICMVLEKISTTEVGLAVARAPEELAFVYEFGLSSCH